MQEFPFYDWFYQILTNMHIFYPFSGWEGWWCTILTAKDVDGVKLSALMLEVLVENKNFDGLVGSYNCMFILFSSLKPEIVYSFLFI